jgi:putative ribosome biogenesis GTPase RsgA
MLDRAVRMYHRVATVHDLPEVRNTPKNAESNFEDIVALATQCRFSNRRHESEPACAVNAAVGLGEMDASHVADYLKIASPRRRRQPRV